MIDPLKGLPPWLGDFFIYPNLPAKHSCCYKIAGLTIKVQADLPVQDHTFHSKFKNFETHAPLDPIICLSHHFYLPEIKPADFGHRIYQAPPWVIYRQENFWLYHGFTEDGEGSSFQKMGFFSPDHTRGEIFSFGPDVFEQGHLTSLSLFPTDQIILARVLADYQGCFLHAAGMIIKGQGMLFAGHSEAGKSTIAAMLGDEGELLCDDRMVVRLWPKTFQIHGTWSHGDISKVSADSAPLKALFFLEQASTNQIIPIDNRREIIRRLLFLVIKPLVTADWWEKTLTLIEKIAGEVPCYILKFDRSGKIRYVINEAGL